MELKPSTRATASFRKVPTLPRPARFFVVGMFAMSFMSMVKEAVEHTS